MRDIAAFEHRTARRSVLAQRDQLGFGRPARRIAQVERSPGIVFGMLGQPDTAGQQQPDKHQQQERPPVTGKAADRA